MALFGRFEFVPVFWLTMVLVIIVHELGHAWQVQRFKLKAHEIELHGLGGHCTWSGDATPLQRAWIASGGVLAQLALLLVASTLLRDARLWGGVWEDAYAGLVVTNLIIGVFNLIPTRPLDGVEAWKLPRLLLAQLRTRQERENQKAAGVVQQQEKLSAALAAQDAQADDALPAELKAEVDALLADALSAPTENEG